MRWAEYGSTAQNGILPHPQGMYNDTNCLLIVNIFGWFAFAQYEPAAANSIWGIWGTWEKIMFLI